MPCRLCLFPWAIKSSSKYPFRHPVSVAAARYVPDYYSPYHGNVVAWPFSSVALRRLRQGGGLTRPASEEKQQEPLLFWNTRASARPFSRRSTSSVSPSSRQRMLAAEEKKHCDYLWNNNVHMHGVRANCRNWSLVNSTKQRTTPRPYTPLQSSFNVLGRTGCLVDRHRQLQNAMLGPTW